MKRKENYYNELINNYNNFNCDCSNENIKVFEFEYLDSMNNKIKENEILFCDDLNYKMDISEINLLKMDIEGYKLIKSPDEIVEDNNLYQFIYGKETNAIIEYINKENEEKINEDLIVNTYLEDYLDVDIKEIDGYIYESGENKVKIDEENKIIKIFYKKDNSKANRNKNKRNNSISNKSEESQELNREVRVLYKDFDTDRVLLEDKVTFKSETKFIKYRIKRIEGYKIMDDEDEKSIINEIINGLNVEELDVKKDKKNKDVKDEYEIVMNCDNSDYIIYFKK